MLPFDEKYPEELDSRLIALTCEGSQDALKTLLSFHDRFIYNVALRMLGDFQLTGGFTKEILLKTILHIRSIPKTDSFRRWLYSKVVADLTNRCRQTNASRSLYATSSGSSVIPLSGVTDPKKFLDDFCINEQADLTGICLKGALFYLSVGQRMAFILAGVFEISLEHSSMIMQSSPEIISTELANAQSKIRAFLDEQCRQLQIESLEIYDAAKRDSQVTIQKDTEHEESISDFLGYRIRELDRTRDSLVQLYQNQPYYKTSAGKELVQLFLFRPDLNQADNDGK